MEAKKKFLKSEKFLICSVAQHTIRDADGKIVDAEFDSVYLTSKGEWSSEIKNAAMVSYPQAGHDLLRLFPADFKVQEDYAIVPNTIFFSKVRVVHQITRVTPENGVEITFRVEGVGEELPVDNNWNYVQRRIF